MPRRKTRRALKNQNVDPNASLMADGTDDRVLKKEAFIRDFDLQVEKRVADMEAQMKSIMSDINRMFTTRKLAIKKDIRQMRIQDFLDKGGDMKTLDFSAVTNVLCEDISFHGNPPENEEDTTFKVPVSTVRPTRTIRKRGAPIAESPLLSDAPLTRTKGRGRKGAQNNLYTPHMGYKEKLPTSTPLITPKFDPRRPLTVAREPKKGETLMSLAGSPVLHTSRETTDGENVLSLCLSKQQTLLSGSLFDMTMSPNTLLTSKERLQEAMNAISMRLEDLDNLSRC